MTRRQKTILLVLGIIALIVMLGVVFLLFSKKKITPRTEIPTDSGFVEDATEILPETEPIVPIKEMEIPVQKFYYNNNAVYYIDLSGALWKKRAGAPIEEATRIGEFTIEDVDAFAVSGNGKRILVGEGATRSQRRFTLINTENNETAPLPSGIKEARFLGDNEVIYYKESLAQTGIWTYSIAGKKESLTKSLNPIDAHIRFISENLLLIAEKPTNGIVSANLVLNLQTKALVPYFSNFLGTSLYPIGQGKVLAFTQNPPDEDNNSLYNLVILDSSGNIINTLDITTMPEKCVMDKKGAYLYCAVPLEWSKNMPQLRLPDDYYKQGTDFTEKFYRIDLITFIADEITASAAIEDAAFPTLNEDDSILYFYDRKSRNVFSLVLPLTL